MKKHTETEHNFPTVAEWRGETHPLHLNDLFIKMIKTGWTAPESNETDRRNDFPPGTCLGYYGYISQSPIFGV